MPAALVSDTSDGSRMPCCRCAAPGLCAPPQTSACMSARLSASRVGGRGRRHRAFRSDRATAARRLLDDRPERQVGGVPRWPLQPGLRRGLSVHTHRQQRMSIPRMDVLDRARGPGRASGHRRHLSARRSRVRLWPPSSLEDAARSGAPLEQQRRAIASVGYRRVERQAARVSSVQRTCRDGAWRGLCRGWSAAARRRGPHACERPGRACRRATNPPRRRRARSRRTPSCTGCSRRRFRARSTRQCCAATPRMWGMTTAGWSNGTSRAASSSDTCGPATSPCGPLRWTPPASSPSSRGSRSRDAGASISARWSVASRLTASGLCVPRAAPSATCSYYDLSLSH